MFPQLPSEPRSRKPIWKGLRRPLIRLPKDSLSKWAPIVVALSSLMATLYSSYEDRRFKRLSARPYVTLRSENAEHNISLQLANNGAGSARLLWLRVLHEQKPVRSWLDLLQITDINLDDKHLIHGDYTWNGIAPFSTVRLIEFPRDHPNFKRAAQAISQITVQTCYCSVYDECWFLDSPMSQFFSETITLGCPPPPNDLLTPATH
jgi:hypothetical protein